MAGSQLKRLKETLKANGLTGQTNIKKKGKSKAPSDTRRDDKEQIIQNIRDEFNPFEIKVNRVKYDIPNKKVPVARPGISKQIGEDERKAAWDARKARHNKVGGLTDRRFGEHDSDMTAEERMLARFTRERQNESAKAARYNLEEETDTLTHYGRSLADKDSFDNDDLMISDEDDEEMFAQKKRQYHETMDAEEAPVKKTKAEVMKEVMAKSKFYKRERQMQNEKNESATFELNDEFDDVMAELNGVPRPKNLFEPKSDKAREYDLAVKALSLEKRAAPADRTKTDEEVATERATKMRELEDARLRRMEGLDNYDGETKVADADDLDDEFWAGSDENEEDGFTIKEDGVAGEADGSEEEEAEEGSEDEADGRVRDFSGPNVMKIGNRVVSVGTVTKAVPTLCPATHAEFLASLADVAFVNQPRYVAKILDVYRPNLAEGNKEKIAVFGAVLIDHILYLADAESSRTNASFGAVMEQLVAQLKGMSEKYNEALCEAFRSKTDAIHLRLKESQLGGVSVYPAVSDLVFYSLVGSIYSTSDHYHLVVTPSLILMAEHLEQSKVRTLHDLFAGLYIVDLFMHYQRLSKRYAPEVTSFLERALLMLVPEAERLDARALLSVSEVTVSPFALAKTDRLEERVLCLTQMHDYQGTEFKSALLFKTLTLVDAACGIWREKSAFVEISASFLVILKHLLQYQPHEPVVLMVEKLVKLTRFAQETHKPLTLQSHRPLAIATYVPKFEENFNPDKKSYDPNRERQEIGKLKTAIKKERKITMREIRKDTKFTARQQIKEKKEENEKYHAKMKHIYNSVSTVEGAAKNQYDREKRLRKGKK